jgi:hypothetical protein
MSPDSSTGLGFRGGDQNIDMRIGPDGTSRLSFADRDGREITGVGVLPPSSSLVRAGADSVPEREASPQTPKRPRVRTTSGSKGRAWLAP